MRIRPHPESSSAVVRYLFEPVVIFAEPVRSEFTQGIAMGAPPAADHPDAAILALFAAGRLASSQMERVGEHVAECPVCLAVLEQVPEDSMVRLLQAHRSAIDSAPGESGAAEAAVEELGGFLDVMAADLPLPPQRDGAAVEGSGPSFEVEDVPGKAPGMLAAQGRSCPLMSPTSVACRRGRSRILATRWKPCSVGRE
jgi:hypothetical protein